MRNLLKLLVFCICICTFTFSQKIHTIKNVTQFAIYPGCEEKTDNYVECFNMKLSHDVEERLSKIKPALINENPVKVSFNIPVNYNLK